jgi:Tfp pilus assembly protein PilX
MKLNKDQKIQVRETLKAILSSGESQIVFEKADGTIRTMFCTRDKDILPSDMVESTSTNIKRAEAIDMLPVYDTEKESWRAFSFDKLISVNGVKAEHLVQLITH